MLALAIMVDDAWPTGPVDERKQANGIGDHTLKSPGASFARLEKLVGSRMTDLGRGSMMRKISGKWFSESSLEVDALRSFSCTGMQLKNKIIRSKRL